MRVSNLRFLVSLGFIVLLHFGVLGQGQDGNAPDVNTKVNGEYVGGIYNGEAHYSGQVEKRDFIVNSKESLLNALKEAKSGQVIYIEDDAIIDLSDQKNITIRAGITIASGRGKNGSLGGLIRATEPGTNPLFRCGSNVVIKGIRFDGGDTDIYHNNVKFEGATADSDNRYKTPVTVCIRTNYPGLVVENCEFYGWTHAAISIQTGATNAKVLYNYIHHNRRFGLGYGVVLNGGTAEIKGNLFDHNRHDIAGTGIEGTSYTASYNVFLENGTSHSVDMHGGKDRQDGTDIAGSSIKVFNNNFKLAPSRRAVVIRGIPLEGAIIENNVINYTTSGAGKSTVQRVAAFLFGKSASKSSEVSYEEPFRQLNARGNMTIGKNRINK